MKSLSLPDSSCKGKSKRKVSLPLILFSFLFFFYSFQPLSAQVNLVVQDPLCFTDMDNNPVYDEDNIAGQITVTSILFIDDGSISYNDPGSLCSDPGVPNDPAGSVKIIVANNFEMRDAGTAIYTQNRIQAGKGGDITITVGGTFLMKNGTLISSDNLTSTVDGPTLGRSAGKIVVNVVGDLTMETGSIIRANSAHGNGGDIELTSAEDIYIDGHVLSQNNSPQSGSGTNQAHGGYIFIQAGNSLKVDDNGIVSSKGFDAGADLVHLCGCVIDVFGLVESTATGHGIPSDPPNHLNNTFRPDKPANSTAGVEIWASTRILIDNLNHNGEVSADLCCAGGTTGTSWIDIFSGTGDITILGKNVADNKDVQNTNFAVHANGAAGNSDNGGLVTIKAVNGKVTASGLAVQADGTKRGGSVTMEAKKDVDLTSGTMTARAYSVSNTDGGTINVRSFGDVATTTGSIVANANSLLDVTHTNGTPGVVNLTACSTVDFPPGVVLPASAQSTATGVCGGNPELPHGDGEPTYVVFCGTGNLVITKELVGFTQQNTPQNDWSFTISPAINGVSSFTIPKAGGSYTFVNAPDDTYTITEVLQADPSCVDNVNYGVANTCGPVFNSNVAVVTVRGCRGGACVFVNSPPNCNRDPSCQWCDKSAVISQVWQNPGGGQNTPEARCTVPDILVDVRLPHTPENNEILPSEIGTGVPATWSIQAAIDYLNANGDPKPEPDGLFREMFIGVVSTDGVPVDPLTHPNACGKTCARGLGGDNPYGVENVVVTNLRTQRMNIFGCSVTMRPADPLLPVFTIQNSVGKVTILDLHVKNGTSVANKTGTGYLIKAGNADLVVVKNSAAWYHDIGYDVQDNDVEITGAQHIYGNRIGMLISGSDVGLRSNHDVIRNTEAGILITGNGNETNNNEVGTSGNPNALGIKVTGNNNNLHDDDVSYNTGNGIYVTGNNNLIRGEEANNNGQYGILVGGTGNRLDGNQADENGKQGIRACGQVDLGGNDGEDNAEDPQVSFSCPDPATAKFSVVDITTDKAYKYDPSFNLISSSSLSADNADANDVVANGTSSYVLDRVDRKVYRYTGGVPTASKELKSPANASLTSLSGMALSGDNLWVVDLSGTKRIYRYSLAAAFAGPGSVLALQQIPLTGNNANGEGLGLDASYLYVLDKDDKIVYRYPVAGGAGVASKIIKDPGGSSLGTPTGAVLDGTNLWIVDNNKDKAYRYVLANLGFGVAGSLNAAAQFPLFSLNQNATGIAVGTSANLLRSGAPAKEALPVTVVKDEPLQVFPNPAHDKVLVQFSSASLVKYKLNVLDATGRLMMSSNGATTDGITVHELDIRKLAKGSYIIVLEKAKMKNELKKLIVQ